MLDATLRRELVELLSKSFGTEQIQELGRLVVGSFDLYSMLGAERHVTVSARRAATGLVEHIEGRKQESELIRLVVESDGAWLLNRQVTIEGVETFLDRLTRTGWVYDFTRRKLVERREDQVEIPNWGALREGKTYPVTVASIDLVGSSELARRHGQRKVRKLFHYFRRFLREKLRYYDGRIWSWGGDGGIVAFTFREHERRAAQCAVELQRTIPLFCTQSVYPIEENVRLRIGMDAGPVTFHHDTGSIIADAINFAAHVEKKVTPSGAVGISAEVQRQLPAKLAAVFPNEGMLEGRVVYTAARELDEI